MSEGNVYLCRWEKRQDLYRVWVEKRPKLKAKASSLDDALKELRDVVCESLGDGEAVFELDPPPENEQHATLVSLAWNSSCAPARNISLEVFSQLYEGGICTVCCTGIGPRTVKPFPIGRFSSDDLQFTYFIFSSSLVASERFRDLLSDEEQASLEWRAVDPQGKTRRTFFELVPKATASYVVDSEKKVDGWRCPACGHRAFGNSRVFDPFLDVSELPAPLPKLFMIVGSKTPDLVIPRSRWLELRGQPGTRGIITQPVTVLPSSRALYSPELPVLNDEGIAARRRRLQHQLTGS